MTSIITEYHEKINIPTQDAIPKSRSFNCLKYSILISLIILILLAILSAIIAETFVKPHKKDALTIGIVAVVGICLFIFGIVAVLKEHIPLVLCFSFSLIIYLLIFMYSRIFISPGWIMLRTIIILALAIGSFIFAILIREWRYLQMSKLNHTAMKEYAKQYQESIYSVHYEVPRNIYNQNNNYPYYSQADGYSQNLLTNNQPQVFINGLPNQYDRNINRNRVGQQVHFQNDPYLPSNHQQNQQTQQNLQRFTTYQQQQRQQQHARTLPPYVDLSDDINPYPDERYGQKVLLC